MAAEDDDDSDSLVGNLWLLAPQAEEAEKIQGTSRGGPPEHKVTPIYAEVTIAG